MYNNSFNYEVFKKNAKTFSFAALFLGRNKIDDIVCFYRFCRLIDDIADESDDVNEARKALEKIKSDIQNNKTDDEFLKEFISIVEENNLNKNYIFDLIDGVLSDCREHIYLETEEELIRYSYQVAGTVGGLMCPLLGVNQNNREKAISAAIGLGIAMQLTNIARDIKEDAENNRCYIPKEWEEFNELEVLKSEPVYPAQDARVSCQKLTEHADRYYDLAKTGYAYLPFRSRLAIMVAAHLYRHIGVKLKKNKFSYWKGRTYLSKIEKFIQLFFLFPQMITPSFWIKSQSTNKLPLGLPYVGRDI